MRVIPTPPARGYPATGKVLGDDVQIAFDGMMSGGEGFSFDYSTVSTTPLPSSWTMMGLVGLGFVAYRRKNKTASVHC